MCEGCPLASQDGFLVVGLRVGLLQDPGVRSVVLWLPVFRLGSLPRPPWFSKVPSGRLLIFFLVNEGPQALTASLGLDLAAHGLVRHSLLAGSHCLCWNGLCSSALVQLWGRRLCLLFPSEYQMSRREGDIRDVLTLLFVEGGWYLF